MRQRKAGQRTAEHTNYVSNASSVNLVCLRALVLFSCFSVMETAYSAIHVTD